MPIIKELSSQIEDICAGSIRELPAQYGHAIGVIAQVGRDEALHGEGTRETQIRRMKDKAADEVRKYGVEILDFLLPELRELIQPEDLEQLEKDHKQYLTMHGS